MWRPEIGTDPPEDIFPTRRRIYILYNSGKLLIRLWLRRQHGNLPARVGINRAEFASIPHELRVRVPMLRRWGPKSRQIPRACSPRPSTDVARSQASRACQCSDAPACQGMIAIACQPLPPSAELRKLGLTFAVGMRSRRAPVVTPTPCPGGKCWGEGAEPPLATHKIFHPSAVPYNCVSGRG